ncbi:hypothetical protein HNP84_003819 [Thermocatellispora tengchongensis]|uniref:DUF6292 domain-containing protein n=1 Tax=Thermocatellispora tengchongensis TaxID=1073253 RepID=A0A840P844_9ACTN|nr:DUF6292 family protein [Thermocatellispora tengchongensis]MBB5134093.1 hypothetical protein [Thermocatellispora tengchongensis]
MSVKHVEPFTDEWRRQPGFYIRQVVEALGAEAEGWSEGPCDPRQATVRLSCGGTLIWDEESGWRYCAPEPGAPVRYLGGGVLPRPERVPAALADARAGVGNSTAWRPCYRSRRYQRDGFDLALSAYAERSLSGSGAPAGSR